MSSDGSSSEVLDAVEQLILDKFRTEPFHNLRLIYGEQAGALVPGGTCSDKTLSFLSAAKRAGFDVALHSAFIGGEEKHRLARVHVAGRVFFADVGDGWPALKLYPADRAVAFRCFGIGFRTQVSGGRVSVYCERLGREALQLELEVRGRPETEILAEVERRFSSGVEYPFSHGIRFSCVVGERFLFLRDEVLEVHAEGSFAQLPGIQRADVPRVVREHFGYEVKHAVSFAASAAADPSRVLARTPHASLARPSDPPSSA